MNTTPTTRQPDEVMTELCNDAYYRKGGSIPLLCNRVVDLQPDGRRHRGNHWFRSPHFGWEWSNKPRKLRQISTGRPVSL